MPSLVGVTVNGVAVAANYLKSGNQNVYGDGSYYSNFGTRQLTAILVNKSTAGTSSDMTKGSDGANGTFKDANSLLSRLVRAVQVHAEIYYVGMPDASNVVMLISSDTMNSSDTSSNVQNGGYGDLEADLATAANTGFTTSGTAFTVTASGSGDASQIFVGASRGTFA
jgi:hypothetical protein